MINTLVRKGCMIKLTTRGVNKLKRENTNEFSENLKLFKYNIVACFIDCDVIEMYSNHIVCFS